MLDTYKMLISTCKFLNTLPYLNTATSPLQHRFPTSSPPAGGMNSPALCDEVPHKVSCTQPWLLYPCCHPTAGYRLLLAPHRETALPCLIWGQALNMTIFNVNALQTVLSISIYTVCTHILIYILSRLPAKGECAGTLTKCLLKCPISLAISVEEVHNNWTLPVLGISVIFATMNVDQCA